MSYSRIYLGVHFLSAIIPGALFGLLFSWLTFRLYIRVRPRFIPDTPLLPYPAIVPRTILCGMLLTHAAITLIAAWWVW